MYIRNYLTKKGIKLAFSPPCAFYFHSYTTVSYTHLTLPTKLEV